MKKILITICARGGSKGIPGKNIRLIADKPLIAYSISCAKKFALLYPSVIALSTDDEEIIKIGEAYGVKTNYRRPQRLATDSAGKIDAIKDLFDFEESKGEHFDFIIDLDVTSPLRTVHDLKQAMKLLEEDQEALNIFSVSKASRNPYFNMVEKKENGYYHTVKSGEFLTRQSTPKVYDMNASFYIYRRSFFLRGFNSAITDKSLIYVIPHLCFDLDEPHDFEFMSFLFENNKLGFEL